MAYRTVEEMQRILNSKQYLQEKLYVNGFMITDHPVETDEEYPFYGNWKKTKIDEYYLYCHKNTVLTVYEEGGYSYFMFGHAVDPFDGLSSEVQILEKLAIASKKGIQPYYDAQNDLTGVYCTGMISDNSIYMSNDCTGMQTVYYGTVNGYRYFTSHSKLVADLLGLKQDEYIEKLVNSRFYHYMGTWLPGDLSPFKELHRLLPNHYVHVDSTGKEEIIRFFPKCEICENNDTEAYEDTISWLSNVLHRTLVLYTDKWSQKRVSISVTGGRDSTTTLACANGIYDKYDYFSYISNESERVDALAASEICNRLGLHHEIYEIPQKDEDITDVETFAAVLECNAGCIGKNNSNDVRKRLYFIQNPKYDIEIKSWINELGRGSQYNKYNVKSFPDKPTASYCRALYKVIVSPSLIHETDIVFESYLKKYYPESVLRKVPWMELFWWEFCWGGGESIFLTAEHRTSSEVAIPYNNRRYIARMLTVPLNQRRMDSIPKDIIQHMNPAVANTGVIVRNLKHTDKRAMAMRLYLEVFSRIHL